MHLHYRISLWINGCCFECEDRERPSFSLKFYGCMTTWENFHLVYLCNFDHCAAYQQLQQGWSLLLAASRQPIKLTKNSVLSILFHTCPSLFFLLTFKLFCVDILTECTNMGKFISFRIYSCLYIHTVCFCAPSNFPCIQSKHAWGYQVEEYKSGKATSASYMVA